MLVLLRAPADVTLPLQLQVCARAVAPCTQMYTDVRGMSTAILYKGCEHIIVLDAVRAEQLYVSRIQQRHSSVETVEL